MTDFGTPPPPPPPPPAGGAPQPTGWWLASDGNWYPHQQWSPPVSARTNGFAIASLVLGLIWIYWVGSILAIVFGHVAIRQIARSGDQESGRGMAIAGLILGYLGLAFGALMVVFVMAIASLGTTSESFGTTGTAIGGGFEEPLLDERAQFLLQDECRRGDMTACDELYLGTPAGSTLEEFGATCGQRVDHWDHAGHCEEHFG
jgi:hypothetical protein